MRHKLKKAIGTKITTNAFYIEACARAVKKYPLTAGLIENNKIKIANEINIGFAVNTSIGLVVPVIKNADQKSLADIAQSEKTLTDSARSNRLSPDELTGETMAISNLGAYDIDCFLGIVPPQTSIILAIGKSTPAAAVFENGPAVRRIVNLSLAVDRRIVDEIYAAKFMQFITNQLENPRHLADNITKQN